LQIRAKERGIGTCLQFFENCISRPDIGTEAPEAGNGQEALERTSKFEVIPKRWGVERTFAMTKSPEAGFCSFQNTQ
jgi:transposase